MRLHYTPHGDPVFCLGTTPLKIGEGHTLTAHPGFYLSVRQRLSGISGHDVLVFRKDPQPVLVQRAQLPMQERCFALADPTQPLDPLGEPLRKRIGITGRMVVPIKISDGPDCICARKKHQELIANARQHGMSVEERDGWAIVYQTTEGIITLKQRFPRAILVTPRANAETLLQELAQGYTGIVISPDK